VLWTAGVLLRLSEAAECVQSAIFESSMFIGKSDSERVDQMRYAPTTPNNSAPGGVSIRRLTESLLMCEIMGMRGPRAGSRYLNVCWQSTLTPRPRQTAVLNSKIPCMGKSLDNGWCLACGISGVRSALRERVTTP